MGGEGARRWRIKVVLNQMGGGGSPDLVCWKSPMRNQGRTVFCIPAPSIGKTSSSSEQDLGLGGLPLKRRGIIVELAWISPSDNLDANSGQSRRPRSIFGAGAVYSCQCQDPTTPGEATALFVVHIESEGEIGN